MIFHRTTYPPRSTVLPPVLPFRLLAAAFLALATLPWVAAAQEDFYHPELEWKTIESEHFIVTFHEGAERTARVVSRVAEDVYGPVTSFYEHTPDGKVYFIIKDVDDISNGAAYFYENRIELYAPSMDFDLRGTHNWLRNVVTHEFTHVVQIQTAMKFGRTVPSLYLQWLNYESERRPDVLYGYPNVIASYPLSGFVVPVWFAEGVAQYNRPEFRYDFWDTHRDMVLRSYALDGTMLSWEDMGVFGKTSLGNESAYNAGFAFVSYIAQTYGEEKVREISRNLSRLPAANIDGAIERATGKPGREVYNEWRQAIEKDYARRTEPVKQHLREGSPVITASREDIVNPRQIQDIEGFLAPRAGMVPPGQQPACCRLAAGTGFANLYPVHSPDGSKIAYTSAKGGDYFSLSALYVYDVKTGDDKLIKPAVRTVPAWSPDGTSLYYAKLTRNNPHWSLQYDLYRYDLKEEEETRITRGRRAVTPAVSPDGMRLVFVVNADGTSNLATSDIHGEGYRQITTFTQGEQVYNPKWSPAGDLILFDFSVKDGRDIATIRADGTGLTFLQNGPDDARTPVFTPDGSRILFSSDRTGIFNVYAMSPTGANVEQLTNVLGGAFYPSVNAAGDVVYSLYTSRGYKLYHLTAPAPMQEDSITHIQAGIPPPVPSDGPGDEAYGSVATGNRSASAFRQYDDTQLPDATAKPYSAKFTSLNVVPFLRVDNYNPKAKGIDLVKLGAYIFSNDILEKTGFFAGAAFNLLLERDLFLQFFYRGKIPLLYQLGLEPVASLELYNVTRKGYDALASFGTDTVTVGTGYNLLEFDAALAQPFVSQFSSVEFRYAHSRYTSVLESFILPATGQLVASSSDLYMIGNDLALTFRVDAILPARTSAISPVGRRVTLRIDQEFNKLGATDSLGYAQYEISSTGLKRVYDQFNYQRLELNWKEYIPLFLRGHTLTLGLRLGTIFGPPVDEFFDFYAGGLVGMRGYPFYSISGNDVAAFGAAYRFPLVEKIDTRLWGVYFDRIYGMLYADIGDAWTGPKPQPKNFKTDAGIQIRLETFSFYAYPTRIFVDASYGFDTFQRYVRSSNQVVSYGREWRFYLGILFGFDFD